MSIRSVSLTEGSWGTGALTEVPPRTVDPDDPAYEFLTMRSNAISGD